MKKVNKQMLFEDVLFPLNWDSMYIWDAANHMIANIFDNTEAHNIIGEYREETEDMTINGDKEYGLADGNFFNRDTNVMVGMVRGWGRLQYKDKAEERQNNIAKYLLNCLNLKKKTYGEV